MRLRRGEHAHLHAGRLAATVGSTSPRLQAIVTGRRWWSW
jgi:hypothetical protein